VAGCTPILVHFTDESTGNPNYWKWDLGNGTISYLQNPSVTYFVPGNYNIKLIVKNAAGRDSLVKTNYVQVFAAPIVDFTASQTNGCNIVSTNFADYSNASQAWQWDFGDGIFSTEQNPAHTYTQTGSYNVSLKAINGEGCALTLVKQAYINVNNVKSNFNFSIPDRCMPTRINFQNNSEGNGRLAYKWLFGNGDSSVLQNPVYTYPSGGTYSVKLIVSNQFGCEDIFTSSITVTNPVSAAFNANITSSCTAPVAIQFTNRVLANNNYTWSFGDTTFSSASNPVHVFNDTGSYTVKLIIRNGNGCIDSLIKTNYISIVKPFVSFDNLPDSGCTGFNKQISVSSNGTDNIINYLWNFGDGATSTVAIRLHGHHCVGKCNTHRQQACCCFFI
jgi:PKD repeat protein